MTDGITALKHWAKILASPGSILQRPYLIPFEQFLGTEKHSRKLETRIGIGNA